jgi:mersacidin/lichenicidin family type 2 lantibiotic
MSQIDIARALKDKTYFNSLTEEQKAIVRKANPSGEADVSDQELDSVSGGLSGGDLAASTTTTTDLKQCTCSGANPGGGADSPTGGGATGDCTCAC